MSYKNKHMQDSAKYYDEEVDIPQLTAILAKADKKELVDALVQLSVVDMPLREALLMRFVETGDAVEHAHNLMRSTISAVEHGGFVSYDNTFKAVDGATMALLMAEQMQDKPLTQVAICMAAIKEMMELWSCCDDSADVVGTQIRDANQAAWEATSMMDDNHPDRTNAFNMIMHIAQSNIFNGWDYFRVDLLEACAPLCGDPALRMELTDYLSNILAMDELNPRPNYIIKKAHILQHTLLSLYEGDAEAEKYFHDHLDDDVPQR